MRLGKARLDFIVNVFLMMNKVTDIQIIGVMPKNLAQLRIDHLMLQFME